MCTGCGEEKALDLFPRNRRSPDGYDWRCKACKKISAEPYLERGRQKAREWHLANRDRVLAANHDRYQQNREAILQASKESYAANRDARRATWKAWREENAQLHRDRARAWREANPEKKKELDRQYHLKTAQKHRARSKAWSEANPERKAETNRKWRQENQDRRHANETARRARKRAAFVEKVFRQKLFERDQGICGICGQPVDPKRYHVDHIVPLIKGGEHSYANTQIAHPRCNSAKGARVLAQAALFI